MSANKTDIRSVVKVFLIEWDILVYACAAVFFGLFWLADTQYESGFLQYMICQAVICMGMTAAIMLKMRRYDDILPRIVYCWSCMVVVYVIVKLIKNIVRYFNVGEFDNPLHFRTLLSMMGVLMWVLAAMLIVRVFAKGGLDDKARFITAFRRVEIVFLITCMITLLNGFVFIRSTDLLGARRLSFVPLGTIIDMWNSSLTPFQLFCQYAGNLLLFFPFGFSAKSRNWDKTDCKAKRIMFYLFPVLLTLFIELSQLILNTGCCDIDDVMLNIIGYYIGVSAVMLCNILRSAITKGQEKNMFII